ncbi:MAG: flagellar hook-basal body complex protein, partial [Lachnospiraceae bacterium]|nr:flagellar hook-basal body complex protein [Lachnospiraceae bacterium]
MLRAMDSAVAGLRAHQNKLDVIGNNIANVNTYGFKSQNYTFQEAMYQTSSASTGGTDQAGGTNAAQYGYGSLMGSITTDMTASTPTYLGGFNASIDGQGFFVTMATNDKQLAVDGLKGQEVAYTRVGMFSIDSNGYMVDSSGNFVYGFQADNSVDPITYGTNLVALRAPHCTASTTTPVTYTYDYNGEAALLS